MTDLFEVAFAAMDQAAAADGCQRQTLFEDAIRLFHFAQAIEADKSTLDSEPRCFVLLPCNLVQS